MRAFMPARLTALLPVLVSVAFSASMAEADSAPVVVELYTSQGCSYCPPADALLAELAQRDDVLPLALHVDYWDYIGWADTYGKAEFTERQKAYARAAGHRTISTPQMVIGGTDHVLGTRPMEMAELIARHLAAPGGVGVALARQADRLTVSLTPGPSVAPAPLTVLLVRYVPWQRVAIERGENAGREVVYANIVTELAPIGDWDGAAPLELDATVSGDAAIAVIVQAEGMGPILGAAALRPTAAAAAQSALR